MQGADSVSGSGGEIRSVRNAMEKLRPASLTWGKLTVRERSTKLFRLRDFLVEHAERFLEVMQAETGKPKFDSAGELFQCCDAIGYVCKLAKKALKTRKVRPHLFINKPALVERIPLGVVGIISPANYPLVLCLSPTIQALAAGNAVLLKPTERTPKLNDLLEEAFTFAGLGEVVGMVRGGAEMALAVAGSGVDKIAFIGGQGGGRAVMEAAAKQMTPVVLELGGHDAMIVCRDADLERAARGATWGAFYNAGQSCIGVRRLLVDKAIAEPFTAAVVARAQALKFGNAAGVDFGPVYSPQIAAAVRDVLSDAVRSGAKLIVGEENLNGDSGQELHPAVVTGVRTDMRIMREEIFGPVLAILPVADENEAVKIANESEFGLGGSVWTKDRKHGIELAQRLDTGGVCVNDCLVNFGMTELPFGGVKRSGFGRLQGPEGLQEFTTTRVIASNQIGPRMEPHWFPGPGKEKLMLKLVRLLYRRGIGAKIGSLFG